MMTLEVPRLELLDAYAAALRTGWSPSNARDVSGDQLARIAADPEAFVASFTWTPGATITVDEGRIVARLPDETRWIWDGDFCGSINFRHVPGTDDLPPHVSGHIGYAVVPGKRRRGYASQALRGMLPVAAGVGLTRVMVTCDDDNLPSRRVIEACGGVSLGEPLTSADSARPKLRYWIATAGE